MKLVQFAHYTARATEGRCPFVSWDLAEVVWRRLRRHFPNALSALLMPDHLHLVAPDRGEEGARLLGRVLAAPLAGRRGMGGWWEQVPRPVPLTSPDKLRRSVRYPWLNPCRPWRFGWRKLTLIDDPLRWGWSSLRDTVGAVVDPWIPAERVARALGWRVEGAAEKLHAYAVADDTVARGLPFPRPPAPSRMPDRSLEEVAAAALAATRMPREALRRRGVARRVFIGLAYRQGWRHPTELGVICGVHPDTVTRIARRVDQAEVAVAALCLDPRLGAPLHPRWPKPRAADATGWVG